MKYILTIGYNHWLVNNTKNVSALMSLIENGIPCIDNTYKGKVELLDEDQAQSQNKVSIIPVPSQTKIVMKKADGLEAEVSIVKPIKRKRLVGKPEFLQLT